MSSSDQASSTADPGGGNTSSAAELKEGREWLDYKKILVFLVVLAVIHQHYASIVVPRFHL